MKRKKCPVCRRRDVVDINWKLRSGRKPSTRAVADEYGFDLFTMQKHRTHKSFLNSPRRPPDEETMRRIEEGQEFILKHLLQEVDESGELLRRYLQRKEQGESRSS